MHNKTPRIVHPFLFVLTPIFFLFAHNISELSLFERDSIIRLLIPSIVLIGCVCGLFCICQFFLRNLYKAGILTSLFIAIVFGYGHFYTLLVENAGIFVLFSIGSFSFGYNKLYFGGGGIIVVLCFFGLKKSSQHFHKLTSFLNIFAAVLLLFSLAQVSIYEVQRFFRRDQGNFPAIDTHTQQSSDQARLTALPDIYYIILDAYGAQQTLQDDFAYTNREFYHYLGEKGFYIATESRSNYACTMFSLASSLNFEYLHNLTDLVGTASKDLTVAIDFIENNNVIRFLRSKGYAFVHFKTIYAPTARNRNADWEVDCDRGMIRDRFLKMTLSTTMLDPFIRRLYGTKRERIDCQFSQLAEMYVIEKPVFVFAHILLPHEPYVFGAHGEEVALDKQEKFQGNMRFTSEGRQLYIDQLRYTNKKLTEWIDTLLTNSANKPIIVLQADHGPRLPSERVQTWFPILNAYYFPDGNHSLLYQSISPVNTFRILFNTYFNASYEQLPDRSYYSDIYHAPYQFVEITWE